MVAKNINVKKIIDEFQKDEGTPSKRKGTFKINSRFEEAMKSILKAKPERTNRKRRKKHVAGNK